MLLLATLRKAGRADQATGKLVAQLVRSRDPGHAPESRPPNGGWTKVELEEGTVGRRPTGPGRAASRRSWWMRDSS